MAILYKGAGPGTHWWHNDARTTGGFHSPPIAPHSAASAVRHIVAYSHPSPYVSFTASFAVAYMYARTGPAGLATPKSPGYVYEIDTALTPLVIHDPVQLITGAQPSFSAVLRLPMHHDGGQNLILGVASPGLHGAVLTTPPRRLGPSPLPPAVTQDFNALVFALRDAEVLIERAPAACIVNRHPVS